jgi:hypothetical protein
MAGIKKNNPQCMHNQTMLLAADVELDLTKNSNREWGCKRKGI